MLTETNTCDAFERIHEYFLGEFAMNEGQGGGEFYMPSSIVSLLTEFIEPYHGRTLGGDEARAMLEEIFGKKPKFADVPGLCRAATLKEIEAQGWSLNPGRYIGVATDETVRDEDFREQLETLNEELETLNAQARDLEQTIDGTVAEIPLTANGKGENI